jgi:hypothetical protein
MNFGFTADVIRRMVAKFRERLSGAPPPGDDPLSAVREPRHKRPGGRGSAVAVAEPEPDRMLNAEGRMVK